MAVLANLKHEKFCQGLTNGLSATKAYSEVYGYGKSNDAAASRLLRDVRVRARFEELKSATLEASFQVIVENKISDLQDRAVRIQWLSDLAYRQRATIFERSKAYAVVEIGTGKKKKKFRVPGGSQGLIVHDVQGNRDVFKVDGVLMREHRACLEQIAVECGDWTERKEHRLVDKSGRDVPTLELVREAIEAGRQIK